MKLVKQTQKGFQYQLRREEAEALRLVVNQFPITALAPVKISKTDSSAAEREKLLNESLAGHRANLKNLAADLIKGDKFRVSGDHELFRIHPEEREVMLQILNDTRVESWRLLGEPDDPEMNILHLPEGKMRYYQLMHLAGFFEFHFLNLEGEES